MNPQLRTSVNNFDYFSSMVCFCILIILLDANISTMNKCMTVSSK